MEISFKWPSFYFCLLCFQLCNGNPITPSDTEIDSRTKLLTGIISLLLTVCCLVFLAACLCCPRRKSFEKFRNSPVVASSITDIDHGHVNPIANGEFTIFSPLSLPHFNNNVLNANDEAKARTVEDSVENGYDIRSWFNPTETDFPRDKLKYIKELGTGWFGKVVQGAAQNSDDLGQSWTPVVVRILEATSSQKEKILFLQDASIYRCGSHTNILSLVGRSLETVPFLLLQEYCPQGDLKGYLQSNKAAAEKLLSTEYPLIWCCQLTSALKHIHENNMSHLDLASRNCQLTPNLTLKLGDYGLGPYTYSSDYYQGVHTVPVRWCAPESLVYTQTTIQPKKITHEANVWSLGVTMWEICECGEQPYKGLSDDEVISQVLESSNVRLGRPTYSALYTDYIFRLMQSCWTSAESRPTVSQIDTMLTDLLQVHRNTAYETSDIGEFEKRWETSKPNTIVKTDHITDPLLTPDISINNNFSLSLNNLHGSLDNLTGETKITIENETLNDSLTSHRTSVSDISDPGLTKKELKPQFNLNSNLFQRTTSSGSETEDENWRNKVERGAYTEKVRQKSKSVTDLMVLTHVDYSESETETPLPSLDYRVNYKNVRLAGLEAPNNLENASHTFGSEGNLLSVQDTFQEELRKLQEVRRDSLPFVPDTFSQSSFSSNKLNVATSPSKLMQELNSSVDLKPANTVYNVYNVTISPIKVHNKLEKIIDMNQDVRIVDCKTSSNMTNGSESCDNVFEDFGFVNDATSTSELDILRGEESLENTMEAVNLNVNFGSASIKNDTHFNMFEYDNEDKLSSSVFHINHKTLNQICPKLEENGIDGIENETDFSQSSFDDSIAIVNDILEAAVLKITSREKINSKDKNIKREIDKEVTEVQKEIDCEPRAVQISNKKDEVIVLKEKVSEKTEDIQRNEDIVKDEIKGEEESKTKSETEVQNSLGELKEENDLKEISQQNIKETTSEIGNKTTVNLYTVPKLTDLILDNKPLMDLLTKDAEEESHETDKQNDKIDEKLQIVDFDLSLEQKEIIPNSLTHSTLFTSTPFRKREISLPSEDKYSSINLFSVDKDKDSSTGLNYSLETWDNFLGTTLDNHNEHLENMFDSFTSEPQSLLFIEGEKCVEESQVDNQTLVLNKDEPNELNSTYNLKPELNGTYNLNDKLNVTYKLTDKESDEALNGTYNVDRDEAKKVDSNPEVQKVVEENVLNSTYSKDNAENVQYKSDDPNEGTFENGCGWFLHPQPTTDLSGEIQAQSPCTDSYIGFGIDDEIMSAIRNELLSKLPHAQGASAERVQEEEDWDTCERNEVFLRYNVYNTPLSPIPEESCVEEADDSPLTSPKPEYEIDEAGWSGQTDTDTLTHEIETISAHTLESPLRSQFNRHTPSQDSCCSNDTLFNLEELIYATTELEKDTDFHSNLVTDIDDIVTDITIVKEESKTPDNANNLIISKKSIDEFLLHERNHSVVNNKLKPTTLDVNFQSDKQICPLPSPEDKPWKQLPASLQNYKNITSMTHLTLEEKPEDDNSGKDNLKPDEDDSTKKNMKLICDNQDIEDDADKSEEENLTYTIEKAANPETPSSPTLVKLASMGNSLSIEDDVSLDQEHSDKENVEPVYENNEVKEEHLYENDPKVEERIKEGENLYENSDVTNNEEVFKKVNSEVDSFEDYVNIVNMENDKNRLECDVGKDTYINIYGHEEEVHSEDENIYGILTDIRFTGPTDTQMMSTSFSEHNDEQGWESGSDSRSSSSGEFIWKEGEHEESLKALRAAPQDVLENLKPMEGIAEDAFEESDVSSSFTDDEETPEFVPSAWDKFAIPSKSALRSPEKTLNKSDEKKPKGVWFKKQKYHCIYEYPKEPESPVLQSQDLWKPQADIQSFTDWEFDGEVFVPRQESDDTTNYTNRSNILSSQNLYHLTSITDLNPETSNSTNPDDEFFISSSARPFHAHSLSSQFFPGSSTSWNFENATPDSGVEDIVSGSLTDPDEFSGTVPTLKQLASVAVSKKKLLSLKNNEVMGGLRHTRNKLKLDLPPSPSAFTTDKPWFHLDSLPTVDRLIEREKPTFTTFGKSRFMVQHVDTPPEADKLKNVSFEALPYQPHNPVITDHSDPLIEKSPIKSQEEDDKCKLKVEVVRGEASLLDSGDEDSGIESASTLERKISTSQL